MTSSRAARRLDIQGLRALAVVLVVGFHTRGWIPGGYLGVDIFFVVSGFVITSMLMSQHRGAGVAPIRSFFARRARRLLPLLAVTLTATSALGVLLLSPLGASEVTAKTGIAAAVMSANTFLARQSLDYFALPADANALLHTWSLSVEEQFYLLVPFAVATVLLVARRRERPILRRTVGGIVAVGAAVSFGLYLYAAHGGGARVVQRLGVSSPQALAFYASPSRAWEFLAGAGVAVMAPRFVSLPRIMRSFGSIVAILVIVVCAATFGGGQGASGVAMALPVLATMVLLAAGVGGSTPVGELLSVRPVTAVGDVSYGWYLFHWPLIVFVTANSSSVALVVLAAVVSLGLAFVARSAVEDRFRYGHRWRRRARTLVLASTCVAVPLLTSGAAVVAGRHLVPSELIRAGERHVDSEHCNRRHSAWVALDDPVCTWKVADPKGAIVLIGDSHASMWSESVIAAGNDLGYDVVVGTMSGCPMVSDTVRWSNGEADVDCQRFIGESIEQIALLRPAMVLIGTGSTGVLTAADGDKWLDPDGRWTNDLDAVARIWETGLASTVERMNAGGTRVALLNDVPYHSVTTATCGRLLFMVSPSRCASEVSRAEVDAQRGVGRGIEERIAVHSELSSTIDPVPWLGDRTSCSTYRDGTWMYRDADHLSVAGSEHLADPLRRALVARGL